MKTWEFTQDNDEQEIQFDRTYGETSTQYHSIEFTFLDEDTTDEQQPEKWTIAVTSDNHWT